MLKENIGWGLGPEQVVGQVPEKELGQEPGLRETANQ